MTPRFCTRVKQLLSRNIPLYSENRLNKLCSMYMKFSRQLVLKHSDTERRKYFYPMQLTLLKVVTHSSLRTQYGSTLTQQPPPTISTWLDFTILSFFLKQNMEVVFI